MRSPAASLSAMASSIALTDSSASLTTSWGKRAASLVMSSDLVILTPLLFVALAIHLGFKQRAKIGGAGAAAVIAVLLYGTCLIGHILGLDRQVNGAVLAVNADGLGLDCVAFLQVVADIVHLLAGDFGGTQIAFGFAAEVNHGALGIQALDRALDQRTLFIGGTQRGSRLTGELLDAQRDALLLDIDAENHGFDFVAFLEAADSFFARLAPGQVGQVHQAVDTAGQADENTKICDRLDLAADLVAFLHGGCEIVPRIGFALFHAQRQATAFFVHFQNHDLDLIAQ